MRERGYLVQWGALLVICMAVGCTHPDALTRLASPDPAVRAKAAGDLGQQTLTAMSEQFTQMGVPQAFIDRFLAKADPDQMVEMIRVRAKAHNPPGSE